MVITSPKEDTDDRPWSVKREAKARQGASVALVEVPPHASHAEHATFACLHGRLSDRRQWFVQTPAVIELRDGVVMSVSVPKH